MTKTLTRKCRNGHWRFFRLNGSVCDDCLMSEREYREELKERVRVYERENYRSIYQ